MNFDELCKALTGVTLKLDPIKINAMCERFAQEAFRAKSWKYFQRTNNLPNKTCKDKSYI